MRADRLIAIMLKLQRNGKLTVQTLADELEVSRRTILRDITALSSAGIPVYTELGQNGGVRLDERYRVRLTGLQESEVRALVLSANARLLDDVGLGGAMDITQLKLFAEMSPTHQEAAEHTRQRIYIDPLWWRHSTQSLAFLDDLRHAVFNDLQIQVTYERRDGSIIETTLEPYSLVAKSSMWYLVAARQPDGELRTYRVSRFRQVSIRNMDFQRRTDFDLVAYWEDDVQAFLSSWEQYRFTLRIRGERMSYLRSYTPGSWEVVDDTRPDGWFMARFEVESIEFAKMLVFGLGADAVVIEPDELHEAVQTQAQAILSRENL